MSEDKEFTLTEVELLKVQLATSEVEKAEAMLKNANLGLAAAQKARLTLLEDLTKKYGEAGYALGAIDIATRKGKLVPVPEQKDPEN